MPDSTVPADRSDIAQLRALIEARLDGYDRAIVVLQEIANKQPATGLVEAEVLQMSALYGEKFLGVATQFMQRDIAVAAALSAAKEVVGAQNLASSMAIAKAEAATTKQIDAIAALLSAQARNCDEKIDDVKGRVLSLESQKASEKDTRTDIRQGNRDTFGYVVGAVGMLAGLAGVGAGIAGFLAK